MGHSLELGTEESPFEDKEGNQYDFCQGTEGNLGGDSFFCLDRCWDETTEGEVTETLLLEITNNLARGE